VGVLRMNHVFFWGRSESRAKPMAAIFLLLWLVWKVVIDGLEMVSWREGGKGPRDDVSV